MQNLVTKFLKQQKSIFPGPLWACETSAALGLSRQKLGCHVGWRFGEGVVEDGGKFIGWKGDWFLIAPAAISSIDTQNE